MAMNRWDEGHPAWWLNLVANPDAAVRLAHERPRPVWAWAAEAAWPDVSPPGSLSMHERASTADKRGPSSCATTVRT